MIAAISWACPCLSRSCIRPANFLSISPLDFALPFPHLLLASTQTTLRLCLACLVAHFLPSIRDAVALSESNCSVVARNQKNLQPPERSITPAPSPPPSSSRSSQDHSPDRRLRSGILLGCKVRGREQPLHSLTVELRGAVFPSPRTA